MKLCFLLGSGASVPAGLPSTAEITGRILDGTNFKPVDCERWLIAPEDVIPFPQVQKREHIVQFLAWLKAQAACRYADWPYRVVNYEDLAYLAGQIAEDAVDEYENPAIAPFVGRDYESWAGYSNTQWKQIGTLAEEAVNYIRWAVTRLLQPAPKRLDYLGLFLDAAADSRLLDLNLFTLNHDTLMELLFASRGIVDGFDRTDASKIARWKPELFDQRVSDVERRIRLFKLHGSVNWRRFRPRNPHDPHNPWPEEFFGIEPDARCGVVPCEEMKTHEALGTPLLLAGTFNKIVDYSDEIFLELHYRFHRVLAECDNIIVCGYSFGDKGVNKRILDRMCSPRPCRLLVIDPVTTNELKAKMRTAVSQKLPSWIENGQWFTHRRESLGSQELTWKKIADHCENGGAGE